MAALPAKGKLLTHLHQGAPIRSGGCGVGWVLSIGKLGAGQADYYLEAVGQGVEDYYAGAGEAPGSWAGSAADELEVFGQVEGELLQRALSGQHPRTGDPLVKAPGGGGVRVPGFDLTFSAPKSVSLLFGLGDSELSSEVRDAHEAAVGAALGYMERQAAVARRGHGGTQSVLGNGFLAAGFRHRTSRAGDPQLHTHVLVANMTRGPDGRWTALDARRLYVNAKTGGYLYQAQVRAELTRRLGVEWGPVRRSQADLAGVPVGVLRAFSRRRAELDQRMAERGESSSRAAQIAALDTRRAKDYSVAAETLGEEWHERARTLGLNPEHLRDLLDRTGARELDPAAVAAVEDELVGPEGLTGRRSTFTRRDVVQAWCERLPQGADVDVVEGLADELLAGERVVPLAADVRGLTHSDVVRRADGRVVPATAEERRYSTAELLALERKVIDGSSGRRDEQAGTVAPDRVEEVLSVRPELSTEQMGMVRRLLGGGEGVQVVVGPAGTGKTFALDAARAAWEAEGYRVIGAALARRAARELQDGAGIPSTSLAALLGELRDGGERGLLAEGRSVLVVDEAGMVGTRMYGELLEHAAHAHAKVVLVGDDRQLPEIDAGGVFRGLLARGGAVELSENRRQREGWERDALAALREGAAAPALAAYARHGRLVMEDTAGGVRERLISDWWEATQDPNGGEAVMIAARRDDVTDLNARARARMRAGQQLGDTELNVDGRVFAVGDRVVALRNARRLDVLNGTRATITAVDPEHRSLTALTTDGRTVELPASYLDARTDRGGPTLDHGYAITGHKAQGMTTGRAFVLGSEELYLEWGYVALSRGRTSNYLYLTTPSDDRDEIAPAEPTTDRLTALTRSLERSRGQQLATDTPSAGAELAEQPTTLLRREHAELTGRHAGGKNARGDERERAALEGQRHQAHAARDCATRRGREADQRGDRPAAGREQAISDYAHQRLEQLDAHTDRLDQRQQNHSAPSEAELVRYAAITAELDRRDLVERLALVVDPPPHLTAALGPVPERLDAREHWQQTAGRIERYREHYNITDPEQALGENPRELRQRSDWRQLRHEIQHDRESITREPHRGRELEL